MEFKILIIDDHHPIIEGYKTILAYNSSGYVFSTVSAYNAEMAYNIITNSNEIKPFDFVFLDLTLPPFP